MKKWFLLFLLLEGLRGGLTDMRSQIENFCTCWRSQPICEDQTMSLQINLDLCPKTFRWELQTTTTDFRIIIEYNGTVVEYDVTCKRTTKEACKRPILPFMNKAIMQTGVTIEVVPICNFCRCRPVRSDKLTCNRHHTPHNVKHFEDKSNDCKPLMFMLPVVIVGISSSTWISLFSH